MDHWLRTGQIRSALPGIYVSADASRQRHLEAAMLWCDDAVVTGRAAARLLFWPELPATPIELSVPRRRRVRQRRFRVIERPIDPSHIVRIDGVRCSSPELTALDLCPELGADVLDRALRSRQVTPAGLRAALRDFPCRVGNAARRRWLVDSAGNPWSLAERRLHRLLLDAGITGWRGNPMVRIGCRVYHPDVLFPATRLVVEVDGFHHARDRAVFQGDRERQNAFVLAGYVVLRFTWHDLVSEPGRIINEIRRMSRLLGGQP